MPARIYKPSKTAMQSGQANTEAWVLDFELSSRGGRALDGLDILRRHAPAIAPALRHQGRGYCLLRVGGDPLSSLRVSSS